MRFISAWRPSCQLRKPEGAGAVEVSSRRKEGVSESQRRRRDWSIVDGIEEEEVGEGCGTDIRVRAERTPRWKV